MTAAGICPGDEGCRRIVRRHVGDLEILLGQPFALEQDVEPELRDRTFIHADCLALEVGKRIDVGLHQDAVAAMAVIERHHGLEAEIRRAVFHDLVDRRGIAVELAGGDRRHVERGILDDLQFDIEAILLEEALVARQEHRAVADPGGHAEPHFPGIGGSRE